MRRPVSTVRLMFSLILFCVVLRQADAQFVQQGNKLIGTGTAGVSGEYQGQSVSLSSDGNTAIIGGYQDSDGQGASWVFTRSGGVWGQQGTKLVGTGVAFGAYQGYSVSLSSDGNTALVGGILDNNGIGATWVFTRSGSVWSQQGNKLVGTGAVSTFGVSQGASVSLSSDGNTALVGGINDNGQVGAVWVFTRSGGVWSQQGSKLVGTGAVGNPILQGWSVSLSADGNTAIAGGYGDNGQAGAAWVFTRSAGVWSQQGPKLVATGATGSARLGFSVSLSADGNTALVGGTGDNGGAGAVWAFTRSAGVWSQQGTKLVGTGAVGIAQQGWSVSLSADGNTGIVGGYLDNNGVGATWVFTRAGGVWTQQGNKLTGTGAVGIARQGQSVDVSADGSTAIVGGFWDNNFMGAAWVFTQPPRTVSLAVSLQAGWNLVSNPVATARDSVTQIFPSASFPYAYSFLDTLGYQADYTMRNGVGFWEKFPSATVDTITGTPRRTDSIAVKRGWNLVGSVTGSVDTTTITSSVPGLSLSPWYQYAGSYSAATTIDQGRAYWKKASENGTFYFAGTVPAMRSIQTEMETHPLAAMNTITISNGKGGSQTLYFGADMQGLPPSAYYEMPPLPPAGAFDARFESTEGGLMLRTHADRIDNAVDLPIAVHSNLYPVTVSWKINPGQAHYVLNDAAGGLFFIERIMTGEGSMTIANRALEKIAISVTGMATVPGQFGLSQNYPNPFNPTTTIGYYLPKGSHVSLRVFNLLGQEVATLVNEDQQAGYKSVEWNAINIASGVYLYEFRAGGIVQTKRLMVLK